MAASRLFYGTYIRLFPSLPAFLTQIHTFSRDITKIGLLKKSGCHFPKMCRHQKHGDFVKMTSNNPG